MVEDVVSGALIIKSFYFMLKTFFGIFQPQAGAVDHLWKFKGEEESD